MICLDKVEVLKLEIIFYLTTMLPSCTFWLFDSSSQEKKMLTFVAFSESNDDLKIHIVIHFYYAIRLAMISPPNM